MGKSEKILNAAFFRRQNSIPYFLYPVTSSRLLLLVTTSKKNDIKTENNFHRYTILGETTSSERLRTKMAIS
jgi:hypothetical protein